MPPPRAGTAPPAEGKKVQAVVPASAEPPAHSEKGGGHDRVVTIKRSSFDGAADCQPLLQAALDSLPRDGSNCRLVLPEGLGGLARPLLLYRPNTEIRGQGPGVTQLYAQGSSPAVLVGLAPLTPVAGRDYRPGGNVRTWGDHYLCLMSSPADVGNYDRQRDRVTRWEEPAFTLDLAVRLPEGTRAWPNWCALCGAVDGLFRPHPWYLEIRGRTLVLWLRTCTRESTGERAGETHRLAFPFDPTHPTLNISLQVNSATGTAQCWVNQKPAPADLTYVNTTWGRAGTTLFPTDGHHGFGIGAVLAAPWQSNAGSSTVRDLVISGFRLRPGLGYGASGPPDANQAQS